MKGRFVLSLLILLFATSAAAQTTSHRLQSSKHPDVSTTAPSNGQCMVYVSAAGRWTPGSCSTGAGDFLADGSVPMTGAIVPDSAGGQTIGTTSAEWGHIYLHDSKSIYFQANQSLYLTGAAGSLTLTGGNFIPGAATLTLGSTAAEWGGLYLGDAKSIYFQADQSVYLTSGASSLTLTGATLALGANSLTMTGSLAATGARVTKGWFTDLEVTNLPTVNGAALKPTDLAISSQAAGDIIYFNGTNWVRLAKDAGKYLKSGDSAVSWDTPSGAAHDAVTLAASATPILGLSTQEISFDTQTANYVLAGPTTGAAAAPTFRALVAADIPSTLDLSVKSISTTAATTTGGYIRLMEGSDNGTDYSVITGAADAGSYPSFTFGGSQGSEDLVLTASNDLWTFSSTTGAKLAVTPALTLTGGITSIGAAANLSGGTVTLGTIAGAIDAGGATSLEIPNGTGPTVDAAGEIAIDTTSDQLVYYGGAKRVIPYKQFLSFVIAAPAEADDINLLKAPYGMTILAVNCIVQGTTSVTGQLQECSATGGDCADLDSDITCDADGAADDGTLTDSAIASANWLRWKTTSVSGTPTFLTVTVTYSVVSD